MFSFFVKAASTTVNSNELVALQIHSLIGHSCIYQIERIASPLLFFPLLVVLQESANACSMSRAVSRTPTYPLWFISSLNKSFFIFLIFPHTEASSLSPWGLGILSALLFIPQRLTMKCNIHRAGGPSFPRSALQSFEYYVPSSICFLTTSAN